MTEVDQLVFDLSEPERVVRRHVSGGAPRLLRRLVVLGLDPKAVEAAAALVAELDAEAPA